MLNCAVCLTNVEGEQDDYCPVHARAFRNIRESFADWLTAYGRLTFAEFLARMRNLTETGEHVRELARFLVRNPERWEP